MIPRYYIRLVGQFDMMCLKVGYEGRQSQYYGCLVVGSTREERQHNSKL